MARILLSAAGGQVVPSIIQHFQRSGHTVLGIDTEPTAVGRFFCDDFLVSPRADNEGPYLQFLESILDKFDLFFPFIDEELRTLSQAGETADQIFAKTALSPRETLLLCTHKGEFQDACVAKGLPIAPRALQPPAMIKPIHGRGGRGVRSITDKQQLAEHLKDPATVCQTYIRGVEYTVDVLVDPSGAWVFGVARKRLQAKGVCTVGQISMNDSVLQLARQVVETFSFRGPINLQVIEDEESGVPYLIEVNPRLAGSVIFSVYAGFDILERSVTQFFGGEPSPPPVVQDGLNVVRYWCEKIV